MFPASYPSSRLARRTHSTGCDDESHSFRRACAQGDDRVLVAHIGIRHASICEALCKWPVSGQVDYAGVVNACASSLATSGGGFHAVPSRSIAQHITSSLRAVATTAILRLVLLPAQTRSKIALSVGL